MKHANLAIYFMLCTFTIARSFVEASYIPAFARYKNALEKQEHQQRVAQRVAQTPPHRIKQTITDSWERYGISAATEQEKKMLAATVNRIHHSFAATCKSIRSALLEHEAIVKQLMGVFQNPKKYADLGPEAPKHNAELLKQFTKGIDLWHNVLKANTQHMLPGDPPFVDAQNQQKMISERQSFYMALNQLKIGTVLQMIAEQGSYITDKGALIQNDENTHTLTSNSPEWIHEAVKISTAIANELKDSQSSKMKLEQMCGPAS